MDFWSINIKIWFGIGNIKSWEILKKKYVFLGASSEKNAYKKNRVERNDCKCTLSDCKKIIFSNPLKVGAYGIVMLKCFKSVDFRQYFAYISSTNRFWKNPHSAFKRARIGLHTDTNDHAYCQIFGRRNCKTHRFFYVLFILQFALQPCV